MYGPNIPRMLGVDRLPPARSGKITPAEAHGIRLVSLGLLADSDAAVIWRGPMTDKLVRQFVTDVAWGELDVLVADLPPGTGDIAIALARHTRVNGAVMVVTPQAVAADDARRAAAMFRQFEVPLLGLVENMSYFTCPTCQTPHYLFGRGGGRSLAKILEIPFLGEVPLEPEVGQSGDSGIPAILSPGSQAGAALQGIAGKVWDQLEVANGLEKRAHPGTATTLVTH